MKAKQLILTCLTFFASATLIRAGSHIWSGAVNNAWNNAGNWSVGGAPQYGEANVVLIFPAVATRYGSTNGIGNIAIDAIEIDGNNYSIGGYGTTLTGAAYYNLISNGTNNVISMPLTLNSTAEYFLVGTYDTLTLSGALTGPGGFTKFGRGKLTLAGPDNNTYVSKTTVLGGTLDLAKPSFTTSIPTNLVIGDSVLNSYWVEVSLESNHQIDDAADVTVNPNCDLYLQGHMEVIHSLTLVQGSVDTDVSPALPGQLTIFGGVTVTNSHPQPSSISGHLSLAGAIRTFDVSDYGVLYLGAVVVDGGQTAGILKTGTGTMILNNANTYSGNTTVQNGILRVNNTGGLGSTAGNTYVQAGASLELGQVTVAGEHLYLNGAGYVAPFQAGSGALLADQANAMWAGPVTLQSSSTVFVATNLNLTISGIIDGPGQLTKDGDGTLLIAGSNPNTFSGGTIVSLGWMDLGKTANLTALPGPITVGTTNHFMRDSHLRLLASQQIPDLVPVAVNSSGEFLLNDFFETVGGLNLQGGEVDTGNGLLTLKGDVDALELRYADLGMLPSISGHLSLGGATRTFHVYGGAQSLMILSADISDGGNNAGVTKTGDGELWFWSDSTYAGVTSVNEGYLSVSTAQGLGSSAAGTLVVPGATLWLGPGAQIPAEPLTISGTGTPEGYGALLLNTNAAWGGNIVLLNDATVGVRDSNAIAAISGWIGGSGALHKIGPGTLTFSGSVPNSYSGGTFVEEGTLKLARTNAVAIPGTLVIGSATNSPNHETVKLLLADQIADSAAVTVNSSGLLTFDPFNAPSDRIGSLAGNGNVDLVLAKLYVGANNADTEFAGSIAGVGLGAALVKEGSGTFTLSGTNTYNGVTAVNNGHLYVNGMTANSGMLLNPNGHLHGQGTVGTITGSGGWTVPGDNLAVPSHGMLHSGSVNLDSASDFNIDLGGTAPSGNYDRLKVNGTVTLGHATLHLTQSAMAKTNDQFIIIDNDGVDPVSGTFAGLLEGDTLSLNASQVFKISYVGGDGNDVVLIQQRVPAAPSLGSISRTNGGQIQIVGDGVPNWVYTVESTEDLGNPNSWQAIGQATADGNGKLTFVDADAPNHSMRFYRFKAP